MGERERACSRTCVRVGSAIYKHIPAHPLFHLYERRDFEERDELAVDRRGGSASSAARYQLLTQGATERSTQLPLVGHIQIFEIAAF